MKIELKQSAVLGGQEHKCNHHRKSITVEVPNSVKEEAHFQALLKDGMVRVIDDKEMVAPEKQIAGEGVVGADTDEHGIKKAVANEPLTDAEKALVLAKSELAVLIAKEKLTKADKERKAELEKQIAGE